MSRSEEFTDANPRPVLSETVTTISTSLAISVLSVPRTELLDRQQPQQIRVLLQQHRRKNTELPAQPQNELGLGQL